MLYLKTSVKNGIISLYPLNPDEMYYKCEVCGNFYGIDNLSDFSFDDVFLKDYICPQCEAAVEWEKVPCQNLENRLRTKWKYSDADQRVLRFDIQRTDDLFKGWTDDPVYGSSIGLDKLIEDADGIDVIIGGPPCQAYSIAGRVRDEHGMKNDYRNYLFESYIKVLERYKPKAFLFENVPGILSAKPGDRPIIDIIQESFETVGYHIMKDLRTAIII